MFSGGLFPGNRKYTTLAIIRIRHDLYLTVWVEVPRLDNVTGSGRVDAGDPDEASIDDLDTCGGLR